MSQNKNISNHKTPSFKATLPQIDYINATKDFSVYLDKIAPYSADYKIPQHLRVWAKNYQQHDQIIMLAPRGHLKSTLSYHYIMWRLLRAIEYNESWIYLSYNHKLTVKHIQNIKKMIQINPYFKTVIDLTKGYTQLKYTWNNKNFFEVDPIGMLTFSRGLHTKGIICDDILADPSNELNLTVIEKITKLFYDEVQHIPVPKKNGKRLIKIVGTPQHNQDLLMQLEKNKDYKWFKYQAITNEKNKEVLWKERYTYKYLMNRREENYKSFQKEMMCEPLYSVDAYFTREELLKVVNNKLKNTQREIKSENTIIAGWDIGKKAHPSHFTIYEKRRRHDKKDNFRYVQLYSLFMKSMDYNNQVALVNELVKLFKIDKVYFDNTRSELEGFLEDNTLNYNVFIPFIFSIKTKNKIATLFYTAVSNKEIELINDDKQLNSILQVNNNLDAIATVEGHGDAFWSNAMAIYGMWEESAYRMSANIPSTF